MNLKTNRLAMALMIFLSFRATALSADDSLGICLGDSELPWKLNLTPKKILLQKQEPYTFLKNPKYSEKNIDLSSTSNVSSRIFTPTHNRDQNIAIPTAFKQFKTKVIKLAQSITDFVKANTVIVPKKPQQTLATQEPAPAPITVAVEEPKLALTSVVTEEFKPALTVAATEEPKPAFITVAAEEPKPALKTIVTAEPEALATTLATEDSFLTEAFSAADHPFMPPEIYANGPLSPINAKTDLFIPEMAAYAMLEAAMQQVQTVVSANSCINLVGTYDIDLYSDGSTFNPDSNFVVVDSPGSSFKLNAVITNNIQFRGQEISIKQFGNGAFKKVDIANYSARVSYNALGSIMNTNSSTNVRGNDGRFTSYQGLLIHNFYRSTDENSGLPLILEFAQNSLSKLGYPIENFWQRSKLLRGDGATGRTILVKDRFVGPNACRIIVDLFGDNNLDFFWQTGSLIVTSAVPSDEVVEFNL